MNRSRTTAATAAVSRSDSFSFSVSGSETGSGVSKKDRIRFFISVTSVPAGSTARQSGSSSSASHWTTCAPNAAVTAAGSVCMSSIASSTWPRCPNRARRRSCRTCAIRHHSASSASATASPSRCPRITGGTGLPIRTATPVNSGTEQKSSLQSCI
ncbi:hypothetical protein SDC9_187285 [bioreactor metagenome]|uniref:Uncharacterized protein n=1 Tax=bioreactor metagenome TaxID=1076179 RepID=A0A645HMH2_9ZZZZ